VHCCAYQFGLPARQSLSELWSEHHNRTAVCNVAFCKEASFAEFDACDFGIVFGDTHDGSLCALIPKADTALPRQNRGDIKDVRSAGTVCQRVGICCGEGIGICHVFQGISSKNINHIGSD